MSMWTMIYLITLTALVYAGWEEWLKHRSRRERSEGDEGVRRELDAMRARIEALEAIVTEDEYDLKRRIDALDDAPRRRTG